MNVQVKVTPKTRTFHHKGRLSRNPRTHKLSNNQHMLTFPIQVLENGEWVRIAVYDHSALDQAKKIRNNDVVEINGVVKRDHWTNKEGTACSADVFIATSIKVVC